MVVLCLVLVLLGLTLVISSFVIISLRKKDVVVLLQLYSRNQIGLVARNPVLGVSDKVRLKPFY